MSWWMIAAQAGAALGKEYLSTNAAKASAKAEKKLQKYKNTMAALSGAQGQNAITTNTTMLMIDNARQGIDIQRAEIQAEGAATVAAASAGVAGTSTEAVLRDIQRNAARRQYQRTQDLRGIFMSADAQRRDLALQIESSKAYGYIPKPSTAASLLNLAGEGLEIYNTYDKEGFFG